MTSALCHNRLDGSPTSFTVHLGFPDARSNATSRPPDATTTNVPAASGGSRDGSGAAHRTCPSPSARAVTPASLSVVTTVVSVTIMPTVPATSTFCLQAGPNAGDGGATAGAGAAGACVVVGTGGPVCGVVTGVWGSRRLKPMTTPQDVVVVMSGTRL
jgi:hypothetical protein